MIQMVLEGVGYAIECINITQFIYEEACQTGVLGVGSYISKRNLQAAAKLHWGPLSYAVSGLWGFGIMYGALFPIVWLPFAYYWFCMTRQMGYYGNEIINGLEYKENKDTKSDGVYWKQECINFVAWVYANVTDPEARKRAFEQPNPCKEFYRRYHNHHSPDDYNEFQQAVENYCLSGKDIWKQTYSDILDRCMTTTGEPELTIYKGNTSVQNNPAPSNDIKRKKTKEFWQKFNIWQKLAYKNQPNGANYFGFPILHAQLWLDNNDTSGSYIEPHFGFKQFGSEEPLEDQSYYTMDNKLRYRVSQDSLVIDSYIWDKGTGDFDPSAMIDLQTGKVTILKDIPDKLWANYTSGKQEIWQDELATNAKTGEHYYLNYVPVRWNTIYLKSDNGYVNCFGINPFWSLMIIRYPETFKGGGTLNFSTYKPVNEVLFEIIRESDGEIIWEEYTELDGVIRFGVADEAGLVTIKITLPDMTVHTYEHLTPEQACQNTYYNINNMP